MLMDPVVWRGPILAGMIKQFWSDVQWVKWTICLLICHQELGDVPLTIFPIITIGWYCDCDKPTRTCKYDCF